MLAALAHGSIVAGSWALWTIFYLLTLIPMFVDPALFEQEPPPLFRAGMFSMINHFFIMVVWGIYGLIGALRAWRGETFR